MLVGWAIFGTPFSLVSLPELLVGSCYDSLFLGENESPCAHSLLSLLSVFKPRLATVGRLSLSLSPLLIMVFQSAAAASCFVAYACKIIVPFPTHAHHESPCTLSFAYDPHVAYTQHTFPVTQ